jgi:hypothetical protein
VAHAVEILAMPLDDRINCWLYPELRRFDTEAARKQALKQSLRQASSGWRGQLAIWLGTGLLYAWIQLNASLAPDLLGSGIPYGVGVTLACAVVIGIGALQVMVVVWDVRRRVRPRLREMLSGQGAAICSACGYDLTGNISGVCPECGERM